MLAGDIPDTDLLDLSEISEETYDNNDSESDIVRAELESVGIYV